jgi:sugar phosphate isomerase/epimerase
MRPRGIVLRDFPTVPDTPSQLVAAAQELGVEIVHLNPPRWASTCVRPEELRAIGELFTEAGLTITLDLGAVNPAYAPTGDPLDPDGTIARRRQLRAADLLGVESVHVRVGSPESRDDPTEPWATQLDMAERALADLGPLSAELGVPVVLKTHEEMSSHEALALAEAAGDHVRIGFSAVNLLVCLEEPRAAARRLAHRVHTVFLDDAAMSWAPEGMARRMRPVGDGGVDWPTLLTLLPAQAPLVLDLHRAELTAPCYRDGWVTSRPTIAVEEIVALASIAAPDAASAPLRERRGRGLAALSVLAGIT